MALYEDRLTLRARPLTNTDFANNGGSMTMSRAGMGSATYSYQVGDFLCQRWIGTMRDSWIEPNATFATSGWFPVSPPDGNGYVQYGGHRISDVTDMDNGFFHCSVGCMVDYATFYASHVLVTP